MTDKPETPSEESRHHDDLLNGLIAYDASLPEYDGVLAKFHNTIGDARIDEKLEPPIDADLDELIAQGGMVVLGRGALREIIQQLKGCRAALDVYGFTLEFVLLLEGSNAGDEGILQSQIQAARDAYKEITGDDPEALYRSSRE